MRTGSRWIVLLVMFSLPAFASDEDEDSEEAPQVVALAGYSHYKLKRFNLAVEDPGSSDRAARDHLQAALADTLDGAIEQWNESAAGDGPSVVIEPLIEDLRFIRAGWRILAGPLISGTHVTVRLLITELPSGRVLADQKFSDSTNAFVGAITFGGSDNRTLSSVAEQIGEYLLACHEAVPTSDVPFVVGVPQVLE